MTPLEQLHGLIRKYVKDIGSMPSSLYLPVELLAELYLADELVYDSRKPCYYYKDIAIYIGD